jgi:hypothetical protein
VHRRVPAPADQQQVAGDRGGGADLAVRERGDERGRDPLDALRAGHHGAVEDPDPRALALRTPPRRARRPGVDDRLHPDTRSVQVEGRVVGGVVRGEDDGLATGQDAVAVQERPGRAGQHDAGAVVVGEHDRALVGSGRHDDRPRPDAPHPLTRDVPRRRGAEVVGAPLEGQDETVVVTAEGGGALQVQHLGAGRQLRDRVRHPGRRRSAVQVVGARQQ